MLAASAATKVPPRTTTLQVEASVINPEHRTCGTTNTFSFEFEWTLPLDAASKPVLPKRVLPTTEAAAAEVARYYGPGAEDDPGNAFLKMV